jgi:hypothetical protein
MKTYQFKEAIKILSIGGFLKEPSNHFSKHACLFDNYGALVGQVTYNCYFEICDTLGYFNCGGLLKNGKNDASQESYFYKTINGNFDLINKLKAVA